MITRSIQGALSRQSIIARYLVRIELINAAANMRIESINERRSKKVEALRQKILRHAPPLLQYFERNKDALTANCTKKTAQTEAGSCQWFEGQYSIEVMDEDAAIAALVKAKHENALRRTVALDKNFLLENPDVVAKTPGIRRVQNGKHILNFPGIRTRLEHAFSDQIWTIVFPKQKK